MPNSLESGSLQCRVHASHCIFGQSFWPRLFPACNGAPLTETQKNRERCDELASLLSYWLNKKYQFHIHVTTNIAYIFYIGLYMVYPNYIYKHDTREAREPQLVWSHQDKIHSTVMALIKIVQEGKREIKQVMWIAESEKTGVLRKK